MITFYRWIVTYSNWFLAWAFVSPLCAAGIAYLQGGSPIEAAASTAAALIVAGAAFGLAGLVVCLFALFWVMISLAF